MAGGGGFPTVSVVVPALNEAVLLPRLLDALAAQTLPPHEVVVADAGSDDDTVSLARRAGALVVSGGLPAVGRNAGAAASRGDLVLFLDADVRPGVQFLERAVGEFLERGLDAATAPVVPLDSAWDFRLVFAATARWLQSVARVRPHAVGACILVRRTLHDRLGASARRGRSLDVVAAPLGVGFFLVPAVIGRIGLFVFLLRRSTREIAIRSDSGDQALGELARTVPRTAVSPARIRMLMQRWWDLPVAFASILIVAWPTWKVG